MIRLASIQTGIELQDNFTQVIYGIINSVNQAVSAMDDMQSSMNADIDTSSIEAAREEINQATIAMDELNAAMQDQANLPLVNTDVPVPQPNVDPVEAPIIPDQSRAPPTDPVEIPVTWNTDGLDVFTGTGIERFEQEVQSTNNMLNTLNSTQAQIEQTASTMDILPDAAVADINTMGQRLAAIQTRIQAIENNPVNMGTDQANRELEQLRSQLNQAIQEQNNLNQAMDNMDVSAANESYLRLSQTVSNTERYVRDNTNEQGEFNQAIQQGTNQADDLMQTIKGAVAAYVSIKTVTSALDISDELTMTTARLNMMNDGLQSTQELTNMVYAAAQDARGSFSDMAAVVAKFGNNAKDAFSSSTEVVAFADLVQKQMTIAGASTTEASNAMLQLSQALGSGVLRGDELNSIFEQAPNLIQSVADYLDVPIGQIREMASEGELSADVVKAAIFAASDEINAKFEEMPMTWGQIWTSMQNTAMIAFQPVLQRLNDIANSEAFQTFVNGAIEAMATLANIVLNIFDMIGQVGAFISENWSVISPIVWGVIAALGAYLAIMTIVNAITAISAAISATKAAADAMAAGATFLWTVQQYGLNAALAACPITWIIVLIIALIAIIFAVAQAIANMTGVANSGFGVITGGINVVIQFFKNLGLTVADIALGIGNAIAALGSNMMTAFHNAIASVQSWFYDLLSTALTVVEGICEALNKLPFVEFDYSGISSAADEYAAKSAEAAANKDTYKSISDAFDKGMSTFDTFQNGWASDAFNSGAAWGDGIAQKVSDFSLADLFGAAEIPNMDDYVFDGMADSLDGIAADTGNISDVMDVTEEDLKYLRDIAEQESVNRFTTAEVKIDMPINNNISSDMDLDGVVTGLTDAVNEAVDIMTEGVHD
ncbi:tape measure protein [Lachnospiraceae bacterium OttesenSCG-928-D06]|nr:tape measure protein [Lachnospiraceae bacterium OttesenSCG-928-D06]